MVNGFAKSLFAALAALAVLPVSAAADTYTYDALGRLTSATYNNGVVVQYSYDAAGNRSQVVTTGVAGPNGAPVAVNDSASINVSAAVDIMVRANDSDPDGDTLSVTAVGTPTGGGTVVLQGGGTHVRYTAPATSGAKTFTYTVSDGQGGTASATVTVTVNVAAPNSPPVAINDSYELETYTTTYLTVLDNDNDPDGDPLTITSVSGAGASIGPGGAYIIYAGSGLGIKTVSYTVSDGRGGSDTGTATIEMYRIFPDGAPMEGAAEEPDAPQAANAEAPPTDPDDQ